MSTLTLQPDGTDGVDNFLNSAAPTTNYGTGTTMNIGELNSSAQVARALIKFDLSSLPPTSVVATATLCMTIAGDYSDAARTMRVYRQLKAWTEAGATWNKYDGSNNWTTAGGFDAADCEQTDIGSIALTQSESGEKSISLTPSKVQEWISGALANNGMLIKMDGENNDAYSWHTSDSATANARPKLVIEYYAGGDLMGAVFMADDMAMAI